MKVQNNNLTSFSDHLDIQYGKRGTLEREKYEEGFEAFKIGVLLREIRENHGLTQEQLAVKSDPTKTFSKPKNIKSFLN